MNLYNYTFTITVEGKSSEPIAAENVKDAREKVIARINYYGNIQLENGGGTVFMNPVLDECRFSKVKK